MLKTVLIAVIAAAIITEIIFAPKFSVAQRTGISRRSRTYKMICATMFVIIGIAAAIISDNKSDYAKFMLIGLGLSWVGDLFLHIDGLKYFLVGFFSFTAAHVFYIIAYYYASKMYFPDKKFITAIEIIFFFVIEIVMVIYYTVLKKMKLKSRGMLASAFYGLVLIPMLIKATAFSVYFIRGGYPYAPLAGFMLTFGAFCFFMSDTSLALLIFHDPYKENHRLKNHNVGTYFCAQTLLALTMLFIGV